MLQFNTRRLRSKRIANYLEVVWWKHLLEDVVGECLPLSLFSRVRVETGCNGPCMEKRWRVVGLLRPLTCACSAGAVIYGSMQ